MTHYVPIGDVKMMVADHEKELAQLRADLAQAQAERDAATRRAEQAETVAERLWALTQLVFDTLDEEIGEYRDPDDGEPPEWMINLRYDVLAAALAGQEGGPR